MSTFRIFFLLMLILPLQSKAAEVNCLKPSRAAIAYAAESDVPLTLKPSSKSEEILKLMLGDDMCVISKTQSEGENWSYVQTRYSESPGKRIRGWVADRTLAYLAAFKPLRNPPVGTMEVAIGDYFATYEIRSNGTFRVWQAVNEHKCRKDEHPDEYGACNDYAYIRGHLYQNKSIVLPIPTKDHLGMDVLYIKAGSCLCSVHNDEDNDNYCLAMTPNTLVKGTPCGKPQSAPYR